VRDEDVPGLVGVLKLLVVALAARAIPAFFTKTLDDLPAVHCVQSTHSCRQDKLAGVCCRGLAMQHFAMRDCKTPFFVARRGIEPPAALSRLKAGAPSSCWLAVEADCVGIPQGLSLNKPFVPSLPPARRAPYGALS